MFTKREPIQTCPLLMTVSRGLRWEPIFFYERSHLRRRSIRATCSPITFPGWNLGPANANQEVLMTQVPTGTTFDYIRISGTPGLGTCTTPPYQTIGQIVCHQNGSMAPNTTWTVRLTVKVTAPAGAIIFENGATLANNPADPNMANNTASVRVTVQ